MGLREAIGQRIKALRQARGWSQEELAERSGLSRTIVSTLELGTRRPNSDHLEALAGAFELPVAELIPRGVELTREPLYRYPSLKEFLEGPVAEREGVTEWEADILRGFIFSIAPGGELTEKFWYDMLHHVRHLKPILKAREDRPEE